MITEDQSRIIELLGLSATAGHRRSGAQPAHAPDICRGVVSVTRERDGALALGGAGTPVDWVVEMDRFDQTALLDLAAAGRWTSI